jgi:gliding motility-associated-like protein
MRLSQLYKHLLSTLFGCLFSRFLFGALAIVVSQPAFSQINVSFSADITEGCSPISVSFINNSTPVAGSTYLWDFGNGNVSTAINPQTTYINEGSYSVSLTVVNGSESEKFTLENYIKVHNSPTALFSLVNDTIGCTPYSVSFLDASSDAFGGELTYTWSFGDGGRSIIPNPNHTYVPTGAFDVTLVVENEFKCTDAYTLPNRIHVLKPQAAFGVDKVYSCEGSLEVMYNNVSQARVGFQSYWDFGDGNISSESSPQHLYQNPGKYTVSLKVVDDIGCESSITRTNLIDVVKTKADFTVSKQTVCPRENIRFESVSENNTRVRWSFGDGTSSSSALIQKSYLNAGSYEVWLYVDNGLCYDSISKIITVEHVSADFKVSQPYICQIPATITYQNNSINGVSYEWKFGNGTSSTAQNPSLFFPEQTVLVDNKASYTDTLIVTSLHGCKAISVKENNVLINIPDVKMTPGTGGNASDLAGCVPMNLTFENRSQYVSENDKITSWSWRVNNGAVQTTETISVPVVQASKVPVELTIVTEKGCVHRMVETIDAGQKYNPNFQRLGNYENCASSQINFEITAPAMELISREIWDFGDGAEVLFPMPMHMFEATGQMDVTLTIYNNGCASSVTKSNIVNVLGPYAKMDVIHNCDNPLVYNFAANIIDATSFYWDFGDGSAFVHNNANPTHEYSESGNYVVTLNTSNSLTNCSYIASREIAVRSLAANYTISSGIPCLGNTLTLNASASVDYSPFSHNNQTVNFLWLFEEEKLVFGSQEALNNHRFTRKGINNVSLVVRDANGCADTLRKEIIIYRPEPDFIADYKVGCMPVTFAFTDNSTSDAEIVDWLWNFGDAATSSLQNPDHEYSSFGLFNVFLEVTDAIGCKHRVTKNQAIQAVSPSAIFDASDKKICLNDEVKLFDVSKSDIVSYKWIVSNGFTSVEAEPTVSFSDVGFYSVTLEIIDSHGCEALLTVDDFFHVQEPPVANFSADVTFSNCYPMVVQFTDESETDYPGSWEWHFGENNNVSQLQNPFFIYNRPGYHSIKLVSRTSHGCADTITKKDFIYVGGPYAELNLPDTVCKHTDVIFKTQNIENVFDIRWDFGDGYFAQGDNVTHKYGSAGNVYPVMFLRSDANNTCNKAIVDTLNVLDLQARFSLPDNVSFGCVPWEAFFYNESINSTSWKWDFGNDIQSDLKDVSYFYEEAGDYEVTLFAMHTLGCTDTIKKMVRVHPLPTIKISNDTIICFGGSANLFATGGVNYSWAPAIGLFNSNLATVAASPDETTWYEVVVTDEFGCVNSSGTLVTVQQFPVVFPRDTTLIVGETFSVDLTDFAIAQYSWSPNTNISCADCPNPEFTALESIKYYVAVTDTSGCFTIEYPLNLDVRFIYSVDVPQAFTPNNDGVNDVVYVNGWGIKELLYFRVFNRFGQLVFESSNIDNGWDGTYNGKPQPIETYTYVVQVLTHENKAINKSGTIKLVR